MNYNDDIIFKITNSLQKQGIATRNECPSIDSRPFGRGLVEEMKKRGVDYVEYVEENLNNYQDYSGTLFDSRQFDFNSAKEYLRKWRCEIFSVNLDLLW